MHQGSITLVPKRGPEAVSQGRRAGALVVHSTCHFENLRLHDIEIR